MKRKFSDRIGVTKPKQIQLEEMDLSLRNSLWNLILRRVCYTTNDLVERVRFISEHFFKVPSDDVPVYDELSKNWLKRNFYDDEFHWWDVYNLLNFLVDQYKGTLGGWIDRGQFIGEANMILEEEVSGYRFINGELSPITNPNEIGSIVDAIEISHAYNLYGAVTHLNTALEKLSEKPKPDYRNSIKESLSAIESVVKQITEEDSGGLDKALSILDTKVKFHGAFKSGLLSLYGYTSDEDDIRHAILEEKDLGFDEAKFMLVACSALVNFIIAKAIKHGLLPSI